jgi:hypothetical protein
MAKSKNKTTPRKNHLKIDKKKLLVECEITIRKGVKQFIAVGQALLTVRTKRLYRLKGYKTFQKYLTKEWGITRQHASRLVLAFRLEKYLSPNGDKQVLESEGMARRFGRLSQAQQEEIKKRIAEGANIKEEIEKAEKVATKPKQPSDYLKAKKLNIQLVQLLQRNEDKDKMFKSIEDTALWIDDYRHWKAKAG